MCGIAGVINFKKERRIDAAELERMASCLAHRGPDALKTFVDQQPHGCGLAHCRLAVIDLVSGNQPMTNEDQYLCSTYNGECYNFRELRRTLEAAGHRFKTNRKIFRPYAQYLVWFRLSQPHLLM